jgi:hypothetical protein
MAKRRVAVGVEPVEGAAEERAGMRLIGGCVGDIAAILSVALPGMDDDDALRLLRMIRGMFDAEMEHLRKAE